MKGRVPLAFGHETISDGATNQQMLIRASVCGFVLLTLHLITLTTRKISLLIGVLHLSEESVSRKAQPICSRWP
jgi:hypothetical protein